MLVLSRHINESIIVGGAACPEIVADVRKMLRDPNPDLRDVVEAVSRLCDAHEKAITTPIRVTYVETVGARKVRIGIEAPPDVPIHRYEIWQSMLNNDGTSKSLAKEMKNDGNSKSRS